MRHLLQDTVMWLAKVAPQHEYVIFQPEWADSLELENDADFKVFVCSGVPRQRSGRIIFEQMVYPKIIERAGVDVFLGTNNVLPLLLKVHSVVIMQSLQYFDFPRIYTWPNLVYLRAIVPLTLNRATRIIALSETSKQTIVNKVHVSPEKIRVIYHGLSSDVASNCEGENYEQGCRTVHALTQGRPYILSVSSFYWQKNMPRLVEAFAQLKKRSSLPHVLLLVGSDGPKVTRSDLLRLAGQCGVQDCIICPGIMPHSFIPAFYRNASVTVMPSLYETFGFPVLEAMSCGCPVVTSQIGTMAEIALDCAVLVDPYNVESIAAGITRVLEEAGLRDDLIARGHIRAQAFTLEEQACRYIGVLEESAHG
jgi:glycosyltransferase involved in cell wall biosynthesis